MILNEELFDAASGISTILIDAINKKWDSISNFNSIIVNLKEEGYDDMVGVIENILADENNHVGQLQKLVETLNPETEEIETGKEEAEETLNSEDEVELPESLLVESASFEDDIYSWLDRNYGTTNWKDKFKSYVDKIKSSSYNAVNLTTDINRAIKKYAKEVKVKPQVFMSALQESLRNEDNIKRNKKLVKKEVENESLQEDIDENSSKFYVSYYEEAPAYHPEEGGYYVATCELVSSEEFDNLDDARNRIAEKAEDDGKMEKITDEFYLDRSKYIGCDRFYIIETEKGSEEKGDTIYQ